VWIVPKQSKWSANQRIQIPEALTAILICWYSGEGGHDDETVAVHLVKNARAAKQWIACDCLGADVPPPLMSVALLSDIDTYYLRRLTGTGRPEHRSDCPFFREQAMLRQRSAVAYDTVIAHPEGYFSVLTPEVEKLAQMPVGDMTDSRARRAATPRLARLLWRLMERAHVNTVPPVGNLRTGNEPSIQAEFDALKRGARGLEVAPGIELTRTLFYYAGAYHSEQIFAKLRALARNWPEDHAPQAFMLLYTAQVHGHDLHIRGFAPIHVANRVQCLSSQVGPVSGPFLSLVVIGDPPETHGYTAVRAYAQPIFSGRRFIPVGSDTERDLLERLFTLQNQLVRDGTVLRITKPLFDDMTDAGFVRADMIVETQRKDGVVTRFALVIRSHDDAAPVPTAIDRIGHLILVTDEALARGSVEAQIIAFTQSARCL